MFDLRKINLKNNIYPYTIYHPLIRKVFDYKVFKLKILIFCIDCFTYINKSETKLNFNTYVNQMKNI